MMGGREPGHAGLGCDHGPKLVRMQDFLEMLPLPEYCHPEGPLNLAGYLEDNDVKPDLGPKSYVAFGRCVPVRCCVPGVGGSGLLRPGLRACSSARELLSCCSLGQS